MGGQMTEEELQRWRQALRKAEEEELASIEPEPSERDAALAEFVLTRSRMLAPKQRVTPLVSRRVMIGTGMLLAAGFAVALLPRRDDRLPDFTVAVQGDAQVLSPTPTVAPARVKSDSLFQVVLRPASGLKGEIETRTYVRQGEELLPVNGRFERHGQGTLRLQVQVRDLPGSREGTQQLVFIIARPGKLPGDEALRNALRSNVLHGDTWQLLQSQIFVER